MTVPHRISLALAFVVTLSGSIGCSSSNDVAESARSSSMAVDGAAPIVSAIGGKCLDDSGGGTTNNNPIQLWQCNGTAAQEWTLANGTLLGPGGKCLDIKGDDQTPGTLVDLFACNGTNAQIWTIAGSAIKSTSGYCLAVLGGVNANGTTIELATCETGAENQSWTFGGASNPTPPSSPPVSPPSSPPVVTPGAAASGSHVPLDDVEILTPFASWANAKTTYGAKGDGVTNDAPALQRALDDLGKAGKAGTLYLPAGTYKIDSTLSYQAPDNTPGHGDLGVSIVGDAPTTTILKWAGPAGGAMINQNGGFNVSYSRLTFDGQRTAGFGIEQGWNSKAGTANYSSAPGESSEHVDLIFQDMNIGIMAGEGASQANSPYRQLDSEGQIRRVTFLRMGYAGLNTGSYNALDWWVIDSQFIDCARGLSNLYDGVGTPTQDEGVSNGGANLGAGGFYVYRSLFQASTVADVNICNAGAWLSFHNNVSIGSAQVFNSCPAQARAGDEIIFEGNRIVDTTKPVAISNGNMGALILLDNEFRSATNAGPVVLLNPSGDANGADVISINNRYTVAAADYIQRDKSNDRVLSTSDSSVAASTISTAVPTMPSTPARVSREVFEVASGASAAEIQSAINQAAAAAAAGSVNPVVHLPPGTYNLTSTLVIPAKTRLQLVGDSCTTALYWQGAKTGNMIELEGPSYATVRDLYLYGPNGSTSAVSINHADQAGGRIFIEGSLPGALTASNLDQTQVSAQENTGFAELNFTSVKNFAAVGTGGIGPVTATDSNIVILDTWNEGVASKLYRLTGGALTLLGAQLCPASHSPAITPIVPAFEFDNFSGSASVIGVSFVMGNEPNGIGYKVDTENAETNLMVLGAGANDANFFERTSQGGNVGLIESRNAGANGSTQLADQGTQSPAFINTMLTQLRGLVWDTTPYAAPPGATDVRIYRVNASDTTGMVVTGD